MKIEYKAYIFGKNFYIHCKKTEKNIGQKNKTKINKL